MNEEETRTELIDPKHRELIEFVLAKYQKMGVTELNKPTAQTLGSGLILFFNNS